LKKEDGEDPITITVVRKGNAWSNLVMPGTPGDRSAKLQWSAFQRDYASKEQTAKD
jgi:hypothetical protein